VRSEERGGHVVVRLTGEIDLANADTVGADIRRAVENRTFALALDLCEVTYVDSAGVRLLFDLAAELRARRQELLVVVCPESPIASVLSIIALDRVAVVAADLESALEQVAIRPREGGPAV
jgi:anti-sigma B factor antagonist/stage II sporulation protein AA (anti-sigma F factor antagonist)